MAVVKAMCSNSQGYYGFNNNGDPMSECLPDLPRYICQFNGEWQGADHQDGPWRPIPAPQFVLPWPTDGPAVRNRKPASVVAEATPLALSPAAQAVLSACGCPASDSPFRLVARGFAAAALRAAADQVVPEHAEPVGDEHDDARHDQWMRIRYKLLAIAAELEGKNKCD